ncbi:putative small lipoprotein YifL [Caulobacter ginsengisoli]|uniref:Small lipoprotein YifL n=1 Tax=Caulobacter ginsengisoli TaxID=400775 RepID=A0ABU0IW99_9CAUL|nr:hypothetical protein [Caulobacter ginsengisoli]MDQ0466280.1 putative small lipoprotein YifL [Caulobacter ginsengisoli]
MRAPFALCAALLAASLAACGKPPAKAPAATVAAGTESGQVTVKTPDGQVAVIKGGAAAVAAAPGRAPPAYAPTYPGAAVLSRIETGDVTILRFTTKDAPDQVMAFYRDAAAKAKVPVSADMDMGGSKMFAAEEEGGARGMQLTAAAANGLTTVQLTYHAPKG